MVSIKIPPASVTERQTVKDISERISPLDIGDMKFDTLHGQNMVRQKSIDFLEAIQHNRFGKGTVAAVSAPL